MADAVDCEVGAICCDGFDDSASSYVAVCFGVDRVSPRVDFVSFDVWVFGCECSFYASVAVECGLNLHPAQWEVVVDDCFGSVSVESGENVSPRRGHDSAELSARSTKRTRKFSPDRPVRETAVFGEVGSRNARG